VRLATGLSSNSTSIRCLRKAYKAKRKHPECLLDARCKGILVAAQLLEPSAQAVSFAGGLGNGARTEREEHEKRTRAYVGGGEEKEHELGPELEQTRE